MQLREAWQSYALSHKEVMDEEDLLVFSQASPESLNFKEGVQRRARLIRRGANVRAERMLLSLRYCRPRPRHPNPTHTPLLSHTHTHTPPAPSPSHLHRSVF